MTPAAALAGAATLATALALGADDPRPRLVELSRAGDSRGALALAEERLAAAPEASRAIGLDFLRARLLEKMGRSREANEAYAQALAADTPLAPWSRLRLASAQERSGHPEVAAGLVATLLAQGAPEPLVRPALELLQRTLSQGGDCRLLGGITRDGFDDEARRLRDLLELECRLRRSDSGAASSVGDYLAEKHDDSFAWDAVSAMGPLVETIQDRDLAARVGLAAYAHRDFDLAVRLLGVPAAPESRTLLDARHFELAYAAARSAFWLARYPEAAQRFDSLSTRSLVAASRAEALFQKARSLELAGDSEGARAAFVRSYQEEPAGNRAGSALLGALRIEIMAGDEESARKRLSALAGIASFAQETARAAMFVAVTDLVRGKADRAPTLLALAERTSEASMEEVNYWRGRQAELKGNVEQALDRYLQVCSRRPFHPLALAARRRLSNPVFAPAIALRRKALAETLSPRSLQQAETLSAEPASRAALRGKGLQLLREEESSATWVDARPVAVADWRLWRAPLTRPDELLLALGLPDEAPGAVQRHFPSNQPRFGLTGAQLLAGGPATRRGIQIAESSFKGLPSQVPFEWVSRDWLVLLYPLPWVDLVRSQARSRGIDPALLAAVIREESKFDPSAVSPAAARGLAQLVLPTARRLAGILGLPPIDADDLLDPLVSIPLGASYLAELSGKLQGDELAVAAAYNAGEDQVALWRRYCLSGESEELLAKIGFGETRAYATRVLESRTAYRLIWGNALR